MTAALRRRKKLCRIGTSQTLMPAFAAIMREVVQIETKLLHPKPGSVTIATTVRRIRAQIQIQPLDQIQTGPPTGRNAKTTNPNRPDLMA